MGLKAGNTDIMSAVNRSYSREKLEAAITHSANADAESAMENRDIWVLKIGGCNDILYALQTSPLKGHLY